MYTYCHTHTCYITISACFGSEEIYNLAGCHSGFFFCANAISPIIVFGAFANAAPKVSLVIWLARSTLAVSNACLSPLLVTITASGLISPMDAASANRLVEQGVVRFGDLVYDLEAEGFFRGEDATCECYFGGDGEAGYAD